MDIGENIRKNRAKMGLTQSQLAEQVGIKQCTLAQYERGTRTISLPLSYEITKVLKCSLYDLIGEVN